MMAQLDPQEERRLRDDISAQLNELTIRWQNNGRWHFRRAQRWDRMYLLLGLPAAILSAIAGATALASTAGRIPAAVIALTASALGGAATFLDSRARRDWHDGLAAEWFSLVREAQLLLTVDIHDADWIRFQAREERRRLLSRQADLLRRRLSDEGQRGSSRTGPAVP